MNRYLLSGAVIATPMLLCMAIVIYVFTPTSEDVYPQIQAGEPRILAVMPAEPRLSGMAESRTTPRNDRATNPGEFTPDSPAADVEEVSTDEQAEHWEEQAFSEQSDLQTRAEALVSLTRIDSARGEYALGAMIASEYVDDRQLSIALLRDWRDRTGDPDRRIEALLMQAANDPDAGVAYQAKAALDQVENYKQMENSDRSGSIEGAHQETGIY